MLETDKATMEIPSPIEGVLLSLSVSVGDKISSGDAIGEIQIADMETAEVQAAETAVDINTEAKSMDSPAASTETPSPASAESGVLQTITVPDLGGSEQVEVIELLVRQGETIDQQQGVLVLETVRRRWRYPRG